jgi:hypothetical protein
VEPQFGPADDTRGPPAFTEPPITRPGDWRIASQRRRRKRVSLGWALVLALAAGTAAWGWQWRQELRADQAMVAVASSMRPDAGVRLADDPIAAIAARVGALGRPDPAEAPAAGSPAPPAPAPARRGVAPAPAEAPAEAVVNGSSRIAPADAISAAAGEELVADDAPPPRTARNEAPPARDDEPAAEAAPATPREACGMRSDFALYYCMQAQCKQGRYSAHPQCRDLRERDVVGDAALQVPRRSPRYGFFGD